MSEQDWEQQEANYKKWLSEPFMEMYDDNTYRIRRNLMALAIAVIGYKLVFDGIDQDKTTAIFGINFTGMKESSIELIMSIGLWYLMAHFLFSAWGKFLEWRLRLSGMKVAVPQQPTAQDLMMNAGTHMQKQATLSSWWTKQYHEIKELDKFLPQLKSMLGTDFPLVKNQQEIQTLFNELSSYVEQIKNDQLYIKTALTQYERSFKCMQQNQALRWIIFEAGVPVFLGLFAVVLIICK
ncbi:MAG: hypothetical protein OEX07_09545 [Gammaproteobacteria bacterium]|nr:hypothetical protein [Gammaproteobacteria bacterium]